MSRPEFRLIPIGELKVHEEVDEEKVRELVREIQHRKIVAEPIWVARGSHVILNGHHRFRALQALGVDLVPAWIFDYHEGPIRLERWTPGPPIEKAEVVERAHERRPFPPKTTKHLLTTELPPRPTPLNQLFLRPGPVPAAPAPTAGGAVTTLRGSQRP
jgi:L-serine kinase (ADP)